MSTTCINLHIFREYPCDHYTSVINVSLMNTGCPRAPVQDAAIQLLQLLDQRFFGNIRPLAGAELDSGKSLISILPLSTQSPIYSRLHCPHLRALGPRHLIRDRSLTRTFAARSSNIAHWKPIIIYKLGGVGGILQMFTISNSPTEFLDGDDVIWYCSSGPLSL